MPLADIEKAIAAIARGEIVIVVDDEDRENEGDLIMAAEFATPEKIAFFVAHTSGLICAPVTEARADELDLPLMVIGQHRGAAHRVHGDRRLPPRHHDGHLRRRPGSDHRARSSTRRTRPVDFNRPGHIHVLRAKEGGVLKRAGHTEAAVDLARLAGLLPGGRAVRARHRGRLEMARRPSSSASPRSTGCSMISIADLIRYRRQSEKLVRRVAEARIPTPWATSPPTRTRTSSTATSTSPSSGAPCRARTTCWCGCTASA